MPFHSSNAGDFSALNNDARNRALRTFLQGLGIDLAVALAALVLANADEITNRAALIALGVTAGKTVATTIASYVMRRFLDPSRVPTPLPPANPGEPDNTEGI